MSKNDNNFEKNLKTLCKKVRDDSYAKALYGSLCNVIWKKINRGGEYGCSWRYAGGLVAELRGVGEDYLDFYCSGNEGKVRKDILKDLNNFEWIPTSYDGKEIEVY